MKIIEFSYFDVADPHNEKLWPNWSRCYEYEWVLKYLHAWPGPNRIHNTACGVEGIHRSFAAELSRHFDAVHTDIQTNPEYDITKQCPENFYVVLNISTLEHLGEGQLIPALKNLTDQILLGGLFLCTFDYPGADLEAIECFFKAKCRDVVNRLNGFNGPIIMTKKKFDHYIVKLAALKE